MLGSARIYSFNFARTMVLVITSQLENMGWLKKITVPCWRIRYLLSNASLDKLFWAEVLVYASHLMNCLSSTAIGGKTLLDT